MERLFRELAKEVPSASVIRRQRPAPPVQWFAPSILVKSALDTFLASMFGQRADTRFLEAIGFPQEAFFDYSLDEAGEPRSELWLDYVADAGDGWNGTYAVASAVAQPTLALRGRDGAVHTTHRGKLLIFGGDMAYPSASKQVYEQRLVLPYEVALLSTGSPHPHVYAIPGNHDWYDSLVAFLRLFASGRWLGGWQSRQSRSYFALKLPHGWWLLGTDIQLHSDIDSEQVKYFQAVASQMQPNDRVILCLAEPEWIFSARARNEQELQVLENNLRFLRDQVIGPLATVPVYLAGDLHHYRRHTDGAGNHKITAGGGGAFLHATHEIGDRDLGDGLSLQACYPPPKVSRRLTWRALALPFFNPTAGGVSGLAYLVLAMAWWSDIGARGHQPLGDALRQSALTAVTEPSSLPWVLLVWAGCYLFASREFGRLRPLVGTLHAVAHFAMAVVVAWGAGAASHALGLTGVADFLFAASLIFLGGWCIAPFVVGLYLAVALNGFRACANEAFCAIGVQDYKNFLRLHIRPDGHLTMYPIGIRRVPRRWKKRTTEATPSLVVPDDRMATPPALIEPPITV